jgi:hypothetical protein
MLCELTTKFVLPSITLLESVAWAPLDATIPFHDAPLALFLIVSLLISNVDPLFVTENITCMQFQKNGLASKASLGLSHYLIAQLQLTTSVLLFSTVISSIITESEVLRRTDWCNKYGKL